MVSVTLSINRPESSADSTILIISSISLFEMNEINTFAALITSHSLIFLSSLSITKEVVLAPNCGKIFLARGTAKFFSSSLPNLSIMLSRNPPD